MGFDHQTWGSIPDVVTAIAAVVGVFGLWLARREIRVASEALRTEHERYKEKNALEATAAYANWGPPTLKFARDLVEKLDDKQCESIEAGDMVYIPVKHQALAEGCFSELATRPNLDDATRLNADKTAIRMDKPEVIQIRWLVVSQLSQLEIALLAWHYDAARSRIIEDQFAEHVWPPGAKAILEQYRTSTNGDRFYPALAHFIKEIGKKRQQPSPGPSPVLPDLTL